ncbi:DNA-binding transcriptional regulator, AcrR family [Thermomonospora echinospora]|uniref:DNA-binding transcriptional regulator, AcrR family n=1 Tax=Thermomonospora echinospora TaxID=1992 RepID=A0A1H6D7S2_9ACTN|nr:TetR/AcrR family transcriptional regulator [Thermomonospora echinospora]SEG81467.1 DNA-binding transcriptional regulator, AcrR family [Thermomonospora echinospora]
MATRRRIGAPDAKNRAVLLDAAERLMLEEGYAAVSSRRVARQAGLKPQLVHYYFRTMDELFLEVFRRRAEEGLREQARALAGDRPLRALWEFATQPEATGLTMEFAALANHRKSVRDEIARYAERFRAQEIQALTGVLERAGISADDCPPAAVAIFLTSLSRVVVMEKALGMSAGHDEAFAFVERRIHEIESGRQSVGAPSGRTGAPPPASG